MFLKIEQTSWSKDLWKNFEQIQSSSQLKQLLLTKKTYKFRHTFRISTLNFDNYFCVQHLILFFNFSNFVYLFICELFFDMSRKMKMNSFPEVELIRQRREYLKSRISKQLINQIFEINGFIKWQQIKIVEMQNVVDAQITEIRVYQTKNSNQNVLTFSNALTILIFEINSQSFGSFLRFNDDF